MTDEPRDALGRGGWAAGRGRTVAERSPATVEGPAGPRREPPAGASRVGAIRRAVLLAFGSSLALLLLGNLAIAGAHTWASKNSRARAVPAPAGVDNFQVVDDRVWRGAAPSASGYRSLAARGVRTIVDLRAEDDVNVDEATLARLGLNRVHIPVRDGQAPSEDKVRRFLEAVGAGDGKVFVHCGAGVGRTGTMAAAYLVATGEAGPGQALRRNLVVGPPSLEQVVFVAELEGMRTKRPAAALTAVSRVLDAPRRIWSRLN